MSNEDDEGCNNQQQQQLTTTDNAADQPKMKYASPKTCCLMCFRQLMCFF